MYIVCVCVCMYVCVCLCMSVRNVHSMDGAVMIDTFQEELQRSLDVLKVADYCWCSHIEWN